MGINTPNVRLVVHYDMPDSLEAYYQEAGRAGRDGDAADCVLLHAYRDRFTHQFMIDGAHPAEQTIREVFWKLNSASASRGFVAFTKWSKHNSREVGSVFPKSRRRYVLDYFGDTSLRRCAGCDNCLKRSFV